jgi:hypothetical protein
MADLEEDDVAGHLEQRRPPEALDVELPGQVDVGNAEGDEIDARLHVREGDIKKAARLVRNGHRVKTSPVMGMRW